MRVVNRPLGFLLAVALAAVGVVVVIEVIALAVGAKPVLAHWGVWYRWAERTPWKAGVVRFWAVLLIVVGLVLLLLELKPRRSSRLPIESDHDATDAAVTRQGLAGVARGAATTVDGVSNAEVRASRRTVNVTARAAARTADAARGLDEPVTAAVQQRLDDLRLAQPPRVAVTVTTRSS